MPVKSKSQLRLLFAKEHAGELPKGTARKWIDHTKTPLSKLPERVSKEALAQMVERYRPSPASDDIVFPDGSVFKVSTAVYPAAPMARPASQIPQQQPAVLPGGVPGGPKLSTTPLATGLDAGGVKAPPMPGAPGHAATNTIDRLGGLDPTGRTVDGNNAAGIAKAANNNLLDPVLAAFAALAGATGTGAMYGGIAGAGAGSVRGHLLRGVGRGLVRGGLTGLGASGGSMLGAGAGAAIGHLLGGSPNGAVVGAIPGTIGGALLGGAAGYGLGGALLGAPADARDEQYESPGDLARRAAALSRQATLRAEAAAHADADAEHAAWLRERHKTASVRDLIPGGPADHMPNSAFPRPELAKGQAHEMEHTRSPAIAQELAKDHIVDDKRYYEHLEAMEKKVSNLLPLHSSEPNSVLKFYPRMDLTAKATDRDAVRMHQGGVKYNLARSLFSEDMFPYHGQAMPDVDASKTTTDKDYHPKK